MLGFFSCCCSGLRYIFLEANLHVYSDYTYGVPSVEVYSRKAYVRYGGHYFPNRDPFRFSIGLSEVSHYVDLIHKKYFSEYYVPLYIYPKIIEESIDVIHLKVGFRRKVKKYRILKERFFTDHSFCYQNRGGYLLFLIDGLSTFDYHSSPSLQEKIRQKGKELYNAYIQSNPETR